MICVIFTSKFKKIPKDGNDVLDDVLDVKQFLVQNVCLVCNSNNIHQLEQEY